MEYVTLKNNEVVFCNLTPEMVEVLKKSGMSWSTSYDKSGKMRAKSTIFVFHKDEVVHVRQACVYDECGANFHQIISDVDGNIISEKKYGDQCNSVADATKSNVIICGKKSLDIW